MTEKDENSSSQEDPVNMGDDLESLSLDEKAAFEKIMAEINDVNQGSQDQGVITNPQKAEPPQMDQIQPGARSDQTDSKEAQGAIKTQDEQAAESEEELSDDQQAALDKIMAEINAKEAGTDLKNAETGKPAAESEEELSDDQQTALDKIMAEINAKETDADPKTVEPEKPAPDADQELSDDQQVALDKIMAEINAKGDDADPKTAEIEKPVSDADRELEDEGSRQATSEKRDGNLSIDEFNDELENLLSSAQLNAQSQPPKAPSASKSDPPPKMNVQIPPEPPDMVPLDVASDLSGAVPSKEVAPAPEEALANSEQKQPNYAILQEIGESKASTAAPISKAASRNRQSPARFARRIRIAAVVGLVSIGVIGAGLWRYQTLIQHKAKPKVHLQQADAEPHSPIMPPVAKPSKAQPDPAIRPTPSLSSSPAPAPSTSSPLPAPISFGILKNDLMAARRQLNQKIDEIVNLKAYYQKGIQGEQEKIWTELQGKPIPSLEKAMDDNLIALSIRAIQRRMVYIVKLDTPLKQLQDSSEDLLYLERKTDFFETLNQWVSGPSMPEYKQEISNRIQSNLKISSELSVDHIQVEPPSDAAVWKEIVAGLNDKKPAVNARPANKVPDQQIGREICDGNFSRKYLLTSLSVETAHCLVQWSGKDLYLNELTELTPELAKILTQWPGEWLSLNGIKEISFETAKYLSQWPGKHLSLNGLEKLSPKITAQLSQWRGAQLEMVGLTSIGRWENYTTHLYLSEALQHKLQM
jgi:hypothetical protein